MPRFSLVWVIVPFAAAYASADEAAQLEHFEKKIRPLLIDHCAQCHGERKQSAGLRLDTVAGIRAGADDGPVVVPGKAADSRLLRAVRHEGDYAMPPSGKLPDAAIQALTDWIAAGAVMPRADSPSTKDSRLHWAFQPVRPPSQPKNASALSVDMFIQEKCKEHGLVPAQPTDKRTWLRRVTYSLIGLPPTSEELAAFEADHTPAAYERVVDRLLASPHYGERWARHWLDVARYADTKGYHFTEVRNFPFSYTYRDYVIRSFNDDKPFNRFIMEQLAADQLDLGDDNRPLAAMGLLTLGRRFENNIHDVIDDRLEVVFRGFMGLSVGCARCHDHKYDPITIHDYYSLYGVFANCQEPRELPLLQHQPRTRETEEFEAELARKEAAAAAFYEQMTNEAMAPFRSACGVATYLLAVHDLRNAHLNRAAEYVQERGLLMAMVQRWQKYLEQAAREDDAVFRVWRELTALPKNADWPGARQALAQDPTTPPQFADLLSDSRIGSVEELADLYGEVIANAIRGPVRSAWDEQLIAVLKSTTHYEELSDNDEQFIKIAVKKQYRKLRNDAQTFKATSPKSPPRAMVLVDKPHIVEPVVFLRGNPHMPGPQVPRQFLEILAGPDRKPFTQGSGRLELAAAIASPDNPLTARVIVNRVWAWHFGRGIVATPSDFGTRGEPPSHPELLDWLAHTFVHEDGWSLKRLHRRIVLSATYRQSSEATQTAREQDTENRWLSHFPRRRLDFEALRDSMLAVSGTLDLSRIGGRSEEIFQPPFSTRRTVYAFIERQNLPGTFRAFDFANPDQHVAQRYQTAVPQQALFLMNSPFVQEMACRVASREAVAACLQASDRVQALFQVILGRPATQTEEAAAFKFVEAVTNQAANTQAGKSLSGNTQASDTRAGNAQVRETKAAVSSDNNTTKLDVWAQLAQVLLLSNEFAFID